MPIDFTHLDNIQLIKSYPLLLKELRRKKVIRSKNIVGDIGEYLAIDYYNKTPGLPNLQPAPIGTQYVDALSRDGNRYTIKATTGKVTGVFYGLPPLGSEENPDRNFEFIIIVLFDSDYNLIRINEVTWNEFLNYKKWHSRMKAWNLPINKKLLNNTKTVFIDNNKKS